MERLDLDKLKVKTACCPGCGGWVLQSAFPLCETNKDSQKAFNQCTKAGLVIDVVTLRDAYKLDYCSTRGECAPATPAAAAPGGAVGEEGGSRA